VHIMHYPNVILCGRVAVSPRARTAVLLPDEPTLLDPPERILAALRRSKGTKHEGRHSTIKSDIKKGYRLGGRACAPTRHRRSRLILPCHDQLCRV
jgi:hypothetical protein